jgi:RNA polymerase sigma-70 factor (ECF subfamily)
MPTRANGRPAVAIWLWGPDGGLIPHGVTVLEMDGAQIVGIDAFIDPALLPRFGFGS